MEKKIKTLTAVIVVLVIAVCMCFVKISKMESDVSRLENALHNQHQRLMNEVESIYRNVDNMLKEEASLLSGAEAEYGDVNPEEHTVDVSLSIVPKLISDDMKVQVSINGRSAELTRIGNGFTGTIPVNFFNEDEQLLLTIETDAGIQTQYIRDIHVEHLWVQHLPSLYYCDISGTGTFTEGKYTLDAAIDINCSSVEDTPNVHFEKFVLVTQLNGKELNREDISEDILNYQGYPHGVYFRDKYYMECQADEGDELIIRLEATDSMGYVHKRVVHYWKEHNGATAEAINGSELIYDSDGNLIYGKE